MMMYVGVEVNLPFSLITLALFAGGEFVSSWAWERRDLLSLAQENDLPSGLVWA
jgi:hypothetical protein